MLDALDTFDARFGRRARVVVRVAIVSTSVPVLAAVPIAHLFANESFAVSTSTQARV